MAKVVKDKTLTQERSIEKANDYIDSIAKNILGALGKNQTIAKREEDTGSPLIKATNSIDSVFGTMIDRVKALNTDTTQTADAIAVQQQAIIDAGIEQSKNIAASGISKAKELTSEQNRILFSNSVDESPRGLAMLANPTLLEEIRKDYLSFVDNPISANAVNAFRAYGLLGNNDHSNNIATSLNNRHSPDTVANIKDLDEQMENMKQIDTTLNSVRYQLSHDASRIAGIREKMVS